MSKMFSVNFILNMSKKSRKCGSDIIRKEKNFVLGTRSDASKPMGHTNQV